MGILSIFGIKSRAQQVQEAMEEGAVIVDVRTPQEYKEGHISNSLNIPVQQIEARISTLKKKNKTVIVCCKSGGRAARAKAILQKNGVKAINGGSWGGLNYLIH
ncbi:MAG: rhodanese-like domain-containing protein [Cytophagales bacterium]|nr:rhodanese-like domain-containing protein [Cytophagales bacterium]